MVQDADGVEPSQPLPITDENTDYVNAVINAECFRKYW